MDKLRLITCFLVNGTMGIFVVLIDYPSPLISCARATVASIFILLLLLLRKKRLEWQALRENVPLLFLSGAFFGLNWISFFTACRYISVAVATVCNFTAPVFVILLSPLVLKEKITRLQLLSTGVAFAGVVLISDVIGSSVGQLYGVLLGLAAAIFYCGIIFCNRKMVRLGGLERTFFQMLFAAIVTFIYVFFTVDIAALSFPRQSVLVLVILGVVYTGFSFALYLPVLERVPAHTASLLSYLEPLVAIIVSAVVLQQELNGLHFAGICLIFAGTLLNEFGGKLRSKSTAL